MKNWLFALSSIVVKMTAMLGMMALFSRALGEHNFANLALGLFVAQITSVFIDGGINTEVLKLNHSQDSDARDRIAEATQVRFFLASCICVPATTYYFYVEDAFAAALFSAAYATNIFTSVNETSLIYTRLNRGSAVEFKLASAQSTSVLAFAAISLKFPMASPLLLLAPRAIAFFWPTSMRTLRTAKSHFNLAGAISYYQRLKYYSVDSIFSNLSAQLDSLIVATMFGKLEYALYQPTSRIMASALGLGGVVASLTTAKAIHIKAPQKQLKYFVSAFSLFGIGMATLFIVGTSLVIPVAFGSRYSPMASTIGLLAATLMFRFLSAGLGLYMTIKGLQPLRASINVILILLTLALVPFFSSNISEVFLLLLISQFMLCVMYLIACVNHIHVQKNTA